MKPIKVMWTKDNKKFAYIDGKPYTALEVEVFKDDHPMYEYEEIVMTEKENEEMLRNQKIKKGDWFNTLKKGQQEYDFYFAKIEQIEKMLENLYDDIEEVAVKMSKDTGTSLENARNIVKGLQKDTINMIENTLEQFRKELENSLDDNIKG